FKKRCARLLSAPCIKCTPVVLVPTSRLIQVIESAELPVASPIWIPSLKLLTATFRNTPGPQLLPDVMFEVTNRPVPKPGELPFRIRMFENSKRALLIILTAGVAVDPV